MNAPGERPHSIDVRGTAASLANVLTWAAVPVLLRELTQFVHEAWTMNGLRYAFAAVFFWPLIFRAWRTGVLTPKILRCALVPALFSFLGQVLWGLSPYYLEAGSMAFLVKLAIGWATLGAMVLFPAERGLLRSPSFHIGWVLGVGGFVAIAVVGGLLEEKFSAAGLLIMVGCSFFFGLYGVSVRYYMSEVPPVLGFGIVCQLVAACLVVLMLTFGDVGALQLFTARTWGLLALSSFLGIGLSHVLFYVAIQRLGATIPSALHIVTPFLTALLAYEFLGEVMSVSECAAGVVLVLGGVFLLLAQRALRPRY